MPEPPEELRDEELVLYYYGEARRPEGIRRRLEDSPPERRRYDEICRTLETVDSLAVPEPPEDYGVRVWQRLAPKLEPTHRPWWSRLTESLVPAWEPPARLALAGAATLAVLVVSAFLLGRHWPGSPGSAVGSAPQPSAEASIPETGRQRIVRAAVGRHLDQSQRLLLELANAGDSDVVREEQQRAAELLDDNRIYRRASERTGQGAVTDLLEELERFLLELENRAEIDPGEIDDLLPEIENLLFKVRIVGAHLDHDAGTDVHKTEPLRPAVSDETV